MLHHSGWKARVPLCCHDKRRANDNEEKRKELAARERPNQRGIGPSTPSQTAWAVLGLLAAGDTRSDSVAKGVRWLIERQHEDGSWDELVPGRNGESYYTGTGFPRVFYLAYHLYRDYFPLLALTNYKRAMEREEA